MKGKNVAGIRKLAPSKPVESGIPRSPKPGMPGKSNSPKNKLERSAPYEAGIPRSTKAGSGSFQTARKGQLVKGSPIDNGKSRNAGPAGKVVAPKRMLAPNGPVESGIPRSTSGPNGTKLPGTAKGQLGKAVVPHPNAKSKTNRPAAIEKKSNPMALPSKNRSAAGKSGSNNTSSGKNAKTYTGPKGMSAAPEQLELVKGSASTLPKKMTGKNVTRIPSSGKGM